MIDMGCKDDGMQVDGDMRKENDNYRRESESTNN